MEVIGEAVLSAALESLFGALASQEFIKFASKQQVDKELKKWESKLLQIHGVLDDAEEKQVTNRAVKLWLTKLRDLAYDAEDILDEFHTEALQSKLKGEELEASTSAMKKLLPTCCAALKPSGVRRNMKMASKLEGITARLQEIVNEKKELDLGTITGGRSNKFVNNRMPTTSLIKEPKVYGRKKDKEAIVELLMRAEPNDSPYSVIPIIGMGGVGKTTLAQLVYEEMVEFDCKAWVCVSDDFDIIKITKSILQHWGSCEDKNLNVLQEQLKKMLYGKKFFIVLDDVWNENYESWTALRSPFSAGAPGSKIIVTTRSHVVSLQMSSIRGYELKELLVDDCMSLFAQHALGAENFDANPDLKEIGQQIILKCKGLPLAAKTLGGLLRGKESVKDWEFILNSKMWDLPEGQSNILPALRLSYHYLPSHLKQCFGFSAIFPKDYEFEKNELVLLWMAEGFLQQTRGSKEAKDLGDGYFDDLLSRSFFQQSSRDNSRYIMHDLVSDLAQFVSGEICFCLDDKLKDAESSTMVRHSSLITDYYDTWQRFKVFTEMKNLRTFLVFPRDNRSYLSRKVLDDLLPMLKSLRALSLPHYNIEELPDSIGALKHLRYLDLSENPIEKLPPSLTELINLQTLLLCECRKLVELPMDIGNLINLQYLDISGTHSLRLMPPQISQLKNLSSLSKFVVGEGSGLTIGGLSKLSPLQRQLLVEGLHNVSNAQDAKGANLKEKQGLRELSLKWSHTSNGSGNERNELEVLNSLQPHHQSLEKLSVTGYGGTVLPQWVGDPSFTKMVELKLHHCRKITSISSSIWKLPALRYLSINGMNEVKEVVAEAIPSLETLEIRDMTGWEQWSWSLGQDGNARDEFPNMRKLTLIDCPKLTGKLPRCLPCLKELWVDGCQEVVLKSLGDLPSLTALTIRSISGLECLHGIPVQALVALENLKVQFCKELKYLWQDGNDVNKLANLKHLKISVCEQLASLVEGEEGLLPCNLQVLEITSCSNLEKMPNGLYSLTSLRELEIFGSSKLVSFPEGAEGLPYSLKRLEIRQCGSLESLPYGMMSIGHDSSNYECFLEELVISQCRSLKSFPEGKLPTKLKRLEIRGCENLESLPAGDFPSSLKTLQICDLKIQQLFPSSHSISHLTYLTIRNCHELESLPVGVLPLPNLIFLWIHNCGKLRCVANFIDNLTSLQRLIIWFCSSLESFTASGLPPNLTSLKINGCENLRQPMSEWGLDALTSLERLSIGFQSPFSTTTDVDYFPDDAVALLLPTSITYLQISSHENLKSISRKGIQSLTSLQSLDIDDCPKLQSLPREGFPDTLGSLTITGCPLLTKRCKTENGDYWSIIAHIPYVQISSRN